MVGRFLSAFDAHLPRPFRLFQGLAGVLALIALATGWLIWRTFERTEADARRRTTVQAEAAAVYVGQIFATVAHTLESINAGPLGAQLILPDSLADIHAILKRAQIATPAIHGLAFIDAAGRVAVNWNSPTPERTDLSGRPVFTAHRDDPDNRMRIGPPIEAPRTAGSTVNITVSRRVVDREGAFGGVVAARLDPAKLSDFFAKLGADTINLIDAHGTVHARYPQIALIGTPRRPVPPPEMFGSSDYLVSMTTGKPHLAGAARVPGTDLMVLASVPKSAILEMWLSRSSGTAFVAVVAAFAATAVAAGFRRRAGLIEAQLAERADAERAAHREAEHFKEIARRKSAFLAHMSHEIRTPLNAIIGFSDVIAGDVMGLGVQERYRRYAADIGFSASHLLRVVQRVLDMAKIEAGKWRLEPVELVARDLVADVSRLADPVAAGAGVALDVSAVDPDARLVGDRQALVQMLLNLVVNAIRWSGADRRVRITCIGRPAGGVEFRISDSGPGMTAADAQRVQRPFEMTGDPDVRGRSGTGLGLPLAKMFAELHGGSLDIETAPGKGTTVRVVLPAAPEGGRAADAG